MATSHLCFNRGIQTTPLSTFIHHHNTHNHTLFLFSYRRQSYPFFSTPLQMSSNHHHHHHHHLTSTPVFTNADHQRFLDHVAYDALVWASLHGLLMGDQSSQVLFSSFF